jgi:dTDP-4-amino-4,6-dideoxygalactose transaminase
MSEPIPLHRPLQLEQSLLALTQAFRSGQFSGEGQYTKRCEIFFQKRYGGAGALMTSSGPDALTLAALLCRVQPGDEVILPSFTSASTANAFALRGARLVFVDSLPDHPNLDPNRVAEVLSRRTRAIVPLHYAGVAAEMDSLIGLARRVEAWVIEDAAHGIEARYKDRPLGTIGDLAAFSFHESGTVHCGEAGLLSLRREDHPAEAQVLRDAGTNRGALRLGDVDQEDWLALGVSSLPSELLCALLWSQLGYVADITARRLSLWERYHQGLRLLEQTGFARCPVVPDTAQHNAHAFYLVLDDAHARQGLIDHLKKDQISAAGHHRALHASPYFRAQHDGRPLPNADRFSQCLVRLPLFHTLRPAEQERIIGSVLRFFGQDRRSALRQRRAGIVSTLSA